uniref:Uncharacterized protein n=1 Tax=Nelumbo nucifera TaxID=4432 RepID=A0A822ZFR3_NELNU|nr:TPA_asm: hypothetical protein HUJ06_001947 [Nelumbo nucifera]
MNRWEILFAPMHDRERWSLNRWWVLSTSTYGRQGSSCNLLQRLKHSEGIRGGSYFSDARKIREAFEGVLTKT